MTTNLIKIGNSKGVRIPKPLIDICHLDQDLEFVVTDKGLLISPKVNLRAEWEMQFEEAKAKGQQPEDDLFEGMQNKFDGEEWTW